MREGCRVQSRLVLGIREGKELVGGETLSEGHKCLPSALSNEEINARCKLDGISCTHGAASCSTGKVADAGPKVFGWGLWMRVWSSAIGAAPSGSSSCAC